MVRLALFCSLLLSNVVSSLPFEKGSMVNTVTCDTDTVYAGGSNGELWRMVCDDKGGLVVENHDAVENIANRIEILGNTPQCQSLRLDGIERKIRW